MLNDRDDKYEGDDSEYHFSDEEINYDMDESEAPKAAAPVAPEVKPSGGGLLRSRRILISGGVFLALVLVIYKMVSPGASPDINLDEMKSAPVMAQQAEPANTAQGYNAKTTVNKAPASTPVSAAMQMPSQQPLPSQPAISMPVMPTAPVYSQEAAAKQAPDISSFMQNAPSQQMAMPTMPAAPAIPASATQQFAVPGADATDSKVASLAVQNQRLMEQLQAQYDQRIKDYQEQNKNLQDQVQNLSTKVAGMENKLTEVLSGVAKKERPADANAQPAYAPTHSERQEAAPKIPFNVQAIIPGRAWLKSDTGETITVAEGDAVKGVGRVTKIDPYDGIVEINTGRRVVALSYGSGG